MSYTMWSIDCIALRINEGYLEALKEDVTAYENGELQITNEKQSELFNHLLDTLEAEDLEDIDTFGENYCEDIRYYDSNNNAKCLKIDAKTGAMGNGNVYNFKGYVYVLSNGSSNIYVPDFKNFEDLKEQLSELFYIPKNFKIEDNLLFITGVEEG